LNKGLVIKSTGSWYTVETETGELVECKIKGNLRITGIKSTTPVAVGDIVSFIYVPTDSKSLVIKKGLISSVFNRKNYIVRRSMNLSKQSHIIAANIDLAVIIATLSHPVTTTTFIDRYLASAQAYRIKAVLIFNKTDIYTSEVMPELEGLCNTYKTIGYEVFKISVLKKEGIDVLKETLNGKVCVVNGHSGVGKSSLINLLLPGVNIRTREISDYHNAGKHTTTYSTMYKMPQGGYIIDTPGIKGFGMLDMEPWEISHYFPEIFRISETCQYNNCSHTHEPGCAVKKAVEQGDIAKSRFISYLGLLEADEKYRPAF
jgi:ribosome biogenesis GTPase